MSCRVLASFGVLTIVAAVASAAVAGGGVVRISPASGWAQYPALAVDARGDQTAVWSSWINVPSSDPPQDSIVTASRRAGSDVWSAPATVSVNETEGPDQPAVAVAPSGAGAIAWEQIAPQGRSHTYVVELEVAMRASESEAWPAPVTISPAGRQVSGFAIGIDDRGQVTAAWNEGVAPNPSIEVAVGSTATGVWSKPRQLAAAGHGGLGPQLEVNARGDAILAWPRQVTRLDRRPIGQLVRYVELARYRSMSGAWRAPVRIGRLAEVRGPPGGNLWTPPTPTVAVDARGGASVIWQSVRRDRQRLEVAHRSALTGRWQPPVALATNAVGPVIGTDARGQLTVVWADGRGRILITGSDSGTHWSPATPIPGVTDAFVPWLTVASNGNAVLTWLAAHGRVLVSERSRPNTGWTRPVAVGRGGDPQARLDRAGNATLLWQRLLPRPQFGQVIDAASYPGH